MKGEGMAVVLNMYIKRKKMLLTDHCQAVSQVQEVSEPTEAAHIRGTLLQTTFIMNKVLDFAVEGIFLMITLLKIDPTQVKAEIHFNNSDQKKGSYENDHYIWPNEEGFFRVLGKIFNGTSQHSETNETSKNNLLERSVIYAQKEIVKEETIEMDFHSHILEKNFLMHNDKLLQTLSQHSQGNNNTKCTALQGKKCVSSYQDPKQASSSTSSSWVFSPRVVSEEAEEQSTTGMSSPSVRTPVQHLMQTAYHGKTVDSETSPTEFTFTLPSRLVMNTSDIHHSLNNSKVRLTVKFYVGKEDCNSNRIRSNDDINWLYDTRCTDYVLSPETDNNKVSNFENKPSFLNILLKNEPSHFSSDAQGKIFQHDSSPLLWKINFQKNAVINETNSCNILHSNSHIHNSAGELLHNGGNNIHSSTYVYPSIYLQPPSVSVLPHAQNLIVNIRDSKLSIPPNSLKKMNNLNNYNAPHTYSHLVQHATSSFLNYNHIRFPSINTLSRATSNSFNDHPATDTHLYVSPSLFKRGYARKEHLNSRAQNTKSDTKQELFTSHPILDAKQKYSPPLTSISHHFSTHSTNNFRPIIRQVSNIVGPSTWPQINSMRLRNNFVSNQHASPDIYPHENTHSNIHTPKNFLLRFMPPDFSTHRKNYNIPSVYSRERGAAHQFKRIPEQSIHFHSFSRERNMYHTGERNRNVAKYSDQGYKAPFFFS